MGAALKTVLEAAVQYLHASHFEITCREDNMSSRKVAESSGFALMEQREMTWKDGSFTMMNVLRKQ